LCGALGSIQLNIVEKQRISLVPARKEKSGFYAKYWGKLLNKTPGIPAL
jgi:hypothetical protein